jgi:hypothetical protein
MRLVKGGLIAFDEAPKGLATAAFASTNPKPDHPFSANYCLKHRAGNTASKVKVAGSARYS